MVGWLPASKKSLERRCWSRSALRVSIDRLVLGLVMAFGAGVLLSAVSFELVEEAFAESGLLRDVALGLFAGCAVFSLGDTLIDRMGGEGRKRQDIACSCSRRRPSELRVREPRRGNRGAGSICNPAESMCLRSFAFI